MLRRQYGIATPSSLTPVAHPEDAQPNEAINKRAQKLPPAIRSTAPPPIHSSNTHYRGSRGRGGYRGGNMSQRDQWTQYAFRGNSSWHARGRGPNRGGHSGRNPPTHGSVRQFHEIPRNPSDRSRIPSPSPSGSGSRSDRHGSPRSDAESREPESFYASNSSSYSSMPPMHSLQRPATPPAPEIPRRLPEIRTWQPSSSSIPPMYSLQRPVTSPAPSEISRRSPDIRTRQPSSSSIPPMYSLQRPASPPENPRRSPEIRAWLNPSRSPSPKLPSLSPLKRRKLEHPLEPPRFHEDERRRSISIELSSSQCLMPPPTSIPRFPLPGRSPKKDVPTTPQPVVHIKEESLSPVKAEFTTPSPTVKQEFLSPSPPPSIAPERRLITESCNFYPFPESCKKSDPDHTKNRKAFFHEKNKELGSLGLKRTKAFSRDDGLVIEWISTVPVWSDTLRPNLPDLATAIQLAHEINHASSTSPRRKSSSKRTNSEGSHTPSRRQSVGTDEPSPSQSSTGTRRSQTPKRPSEFYGGEDGYPPHNQMSPPPTPIRDSHSTPRRRLPLPGRQNSNTQSQPVQPKSNPVVVPVAFSPRRPATPVSTSASTFAPASNRPQQKQPMVLPVAFSPPRSARGSATHEEQYLATGSNNMNVDGPSQSSIPPLPVMPKRLTFKPNPNSRKSHVPSETQIIQHPAASHGTQADSGQSGSKSSHRQNATEAGELSTEPLRLDSNAASGGVLPTLPLSALAEQGKMNDFPTPLTDSDSHERGHGSRLTPAVHSSTTVPYEHGSGPKTTHVSHKDVGAGGRSGAAERDNEMDTSVDGVEAEDVAAALLSQSPVQLPTGRHEDDVDMDVITDDDSAASTDGGEMEGLVADFLQRYCQLFDADRSRLEMAYAKNALFSCRVHHLEEPSFSMAGLFAPEGKSSFRSSHSRASASTVDQGRRQIGNRLLALGPYQFCPRGVTRSLLYDAAMVDSGACGGILLTVHGEIVNPHLDGPQLDHVLTLDQSFLLRPRADVIGRGGCDDEDEDDGINGLGQRVEQDWPLLAISHQMTVRAAPLLSPEKSEKLLPWIENIL